MGNAVEVSAQVCVAYLPMPRLQKRLHLLHSLQRALPRTIGVLLRLPLGVPVLRSISLYKHAVAITPVGPREGLLSLP